MSDAEKGSGVDLRNEVLPIADLLNQEVADFVVVDGQVRLKGGRSPSHQNIFFPFSEICPETGKKDVESVTFGPCGTLYSYAIVHVSSAKKVPYVIGYVDFPSGARVLAIVQGVEGELACDLPVELRSDANDWFVVPVLDDNS